MSRYDSPEPSSHFNVLIMVALVAATFIATSLYFTAIKEEDNDGPIVQDKTLESDSDNAHPEKVEPIEEVEAPIIESTASAPTTTITPEPAAPELPTTSPVTTIVVDKKSEGVSAETPQILLKKIAKALRGDDLEKMVKLIGDDKISSTQRAILKALKPKLEENPIREIGELKANRKARWAFQLSEPASTQIHIDLTRSETTAQWSVERISLPTGVAQIDALDVTHGFVNAVLVQDFNEAKLYVDSKQVSDAKIAGLCIIFEESQYRLRNRKPLSAMFNRDTTAAFVAHIVDAAKKKPAVFAISTQRETTKTPWRITEINIDNLLSDYTAQISGGDIHYTPLVRNPAGGDTLILYFAFDEDGLTPRTTKQLDIVAGLLKTDHRKKLTLSGHTDSLGSDDYNNDLSAKRAQAVAKYLLSVGIPENQIITIAEGETRPRQPNAIANGEDNPAGRQENRRTEIYLDF